MRTNQTHQTNRDQWPMWIAKALGDARQYRRTLALSFITVVIATMAVVALASARNVLLREIAASFQTAQLPDIAVIVDIAGSVNAELLEKINEKVRRIDGVRADDQRRTFVTRMRAADGHWLPARVTVVRSLAAQQLGKVHLHPHDAGAINQLTNASSFLGIEQSGLPLLATPQFDTKLPPISLRTSSGAEITLATTHVVHDTAVAPSTQERIAYLTISPDVALRLGFPDTFDQLVVALNLRSDAANASAYAEQIRQTLLRMGVVVQRVDVLPVVHPHAPLMRAMLSVMLVLSILVALSAFALIANFVDAAMKRERRIIGIMRTLGASTIAAAKPYCALHLPLQGMALTIGVAMGLWLSRALIRFNQHSLNIDITNWWPNAATLLTLIVSMALLLILAVANPIVRACSELPRHALSGESGPNMQRLTRAAMVFGIASRRLIGALGGERFLSGLLLSAALRNLWRRPWRSLVLIGAFTFSAALVLTTFSNYESLMRITDRSLADQGHDLEVLLPKAYPGKHLEEITMAALRDERAVVEAWRRAAVSIAGESAGQQESPRTRVDLISYPNQSRLFGFSIVAGRAAESVATDELVITRKLMQQHPALSVGSTHEFYFRDRTRRMRIVGMIEQVATAAAYAPATSFDALTGLGDDAFALRVKLPEIVESAPSADIETIRRGTFVTASDAIERGLIASGIVPTQIISRTIMRDALEEHIKVVTEVIRWIAIGVVLLGAIVLLATTAQNVIDRQHEVAILRAVGAVPAQLRRLFWIESGAVIAISAVCASFIAWFLTRLMLNVAETRLINVAVPMQISIEGLFWLALGIVAIFSAIVLMIMLSLNQSVREMLAGE